MATQESFGAQIWGTLIDPGGDPGAIHRAAGATRKLAEDLAAVLNALDPVGAGLKADWHGPAADAFQQTYSKFSPGMAEYIKHLHDSADSLDKVGDALHEAQVQARNFMIMLIATLASLPVLTVLTFGTADLPELAALDTEAGIVATFVARMGALVGAEAGAMEALISSMEMVAVRFGLGVVGTLATSMGSKYFLLHKNPFDPASYSAKDGTDLLIGGGITAGMGTVANAGKVSALVKAHKVLGMAGIGALGGFSGSALNQFWLAGRSPFDLEAWGNIGISTGLAGTAGGLIGLIPTKQLPASIAEEPNVVGGPLRPNGEPLFPKGVFLRPYWPKPADEARGSIGVVAGTLGYPFNVQEPKPLTIPGASPLPGTPDFPLPPPLTLPGSGVGPGAAPFTGPGGTIPQPPNIPAPHVIPPHTITVHRGDTLSEIALRELGDGAKHSYDALAQLNGIANPGLIYPGQKIIIPQIIIPAALERTG